MVGRRRTYDLKMLTGLPALTLSPGSRGGAVMASERVSRSERVWLCRGATGGGGDCSPTNDREWAWWGVMEGGRGAGTGTVREAGVGGRDLSKKGVKLGEL